MATPAAKLPMWYRVLASVVGALAIVLALVVLVMPLLAVWLLIFLLAFGLLFMGMDRLIIGISGHPLFWVFGPSANVPSSPAETGASPMPTPKP